MTELKKIICAGLNETIRLSEKGHMAVTMGLVSTVGIHLIDSGSNRQSLSHCVLTAYPDKDSLEEIPCYDPDDFSQLIEREMGWLGKENCSHVLIYASAKPYGAIEQGVKVLEKVTMDILDFISKLNPEIQAAPHIVPNAASVTLSRACLDALGLVDMNNNAQNLTDMGPGGALVFNRRGIFNFHACTVIQLFQERALPEVIYDNGRYEFPNVPPKILELLIKIRGMNASEKTAKQIPDYLKELMKDSLRYKDLTDKKKSEVIARVMRGIAAKEFGESLELAKKYGKIVV